MTQRVLFLLIGLVFGAIVASALRGGFMPTYLTGGVRRTEQPVLFWIATAALSAVTLGMLILAII